MTFKRDRAIETFLASAKYYALTAAADLLEQFVIAEVHQRRRARDIDIDFTLRFASEPRPVSSRHAPQDCCGESGGMAAPHLRQNLSPVVILIARAIAFTSNTARKFPKGYERNAAMRWRSSSSISAGVATVCATSSRNTCR